MLTDDSRHDVVALVDAVRRRPNEFPVAELARVNASGLDVSIERRDGEAVVLVANRMSPVFELLTKREHEVATLVAGGCSNAQIASELFVSLATVKDHVHTILRKTQVESRAQMIAAWYGGLASRAH